MGAEAVEYLKQTKRNLKKRGWHKGSLEAYPEGPCCIVGAQPFTLCGHGDATTKERWAANDLLDDLAGGFGYVRRSRGNVVIFNDHPDTTLDDVNAFLDLAIFIAKDL